MHIYNFLYVWWLYVFKYKFDDYYKSCSSIIFFTNQIYSYTLLFAYWSFSELFIFDTQLKIPEILRFTKEVKY